MPKILYLAQFAPSNDGIVTQEYLTKEDKYYAETYHIPVYDSLKKLGYDFFSTHDVTHLTEFHNNYDLVWSLYNRIGFRNSEVFVQSLCEYYGVKYIGAAPNIRALAEDKSLAKQLAEHLNMKTAQWITASPRYQLSKTPPFPGPYFVKPRFGSASIGIDETSLCQEWHDVMAKANQYFIDRQEIIIEEFIDGINHGVAIMNTISGKLLTGTPRFTISDKPGGVLTHPQKRRVVTGLESHMSENSYLNKMLIYETEKYFMEIQPCDYARVDFIVEKNSGIPYFLEVNVLMNLSVNGGFVKSFLNSEFQTYDDIIQHIVELGFAKLPPLTK